MIYTEQYMNTGGFPHQLDLGKRASGVYYLEVITKTEVFRKNLMIQ